MTKKELRQYRSRARLLANLLEAYGRDIWPPANPKRVRNFKWAAQLREVARVG